MKPIIGVTAGFVKDGYYSEGNYVHQDFINCIAYNGGTPIIIPYNQSYRICLRNFENV